MEFRAGKNPFELPFDLFGGPSSILFGVGSKR